MARTNEHGQTIGEAVVDWSPRARPPHEPMTGAWCVLEPLDCARHGAALTRALVDETEPRQWTYLPYGPFDAAGFAAWLAQAERADDVVFHAVVYSSGSDSAGSDAVGLVAYLAIRPETGSIEIGHVHFSAKLRRTRAATEALHLMARRAFDELGYRRYEWKCDALNAPSRRAAERLGFAFEGVFRQHLVTKGRNRDTAWYALTDRDWPRVKAGCEAWLAPENFDREGRQRRRLSELLG